jgi:hypothetical protein
MFVDLSSYIQQSVIMVNRAYPSTPPIVTNKYIYITTIHDTRNLSINACVWGKVSGSCHRAGVKLYHAFFNGLDNHPDPRDPHEFTIINDEDNIPKRVDLNKHLIAQRVQDSFGDISSTDDKKLYEYDVYALFKEGREHQ